jgi:7,8-dihydropterin-6-yl-methyl-4-(beta-D-ribofuranosyl)aminobenzene 5'-phosphate synthase
MSGFKANQRKADADWISNQPEPLGDIGTVEHLSILPLIDWYTEKDDLVGEAGVSYLVQADDKRILFDVGANWKKEDPSPLLRNMRALGIDADSFDAIVISHPHCDHTGGLRAQRKKTFELSPTDVDLMGLPAYVPADLSHPTARVEVTTKPTVLFPGVATTGVILRAVWLLGLTPEQALAVNVRGKGLVVVVGCGHQGLARIIERSSTIFASPLYGLIGGLHYPVTVSRLKRPSQQWMGTGKWPWQRISKVEVDGAVARLKRENPSLVAISAHDSCDWSVGRFREAFSERYRDVIVGREITI